MLYKKEEQLKQVTQFVYILYITLQKFYKTSMKERRLALLILFLGILGKGIQVVHQIWDFYLNDFLLIVISDSVVKHPCFWIQQVHGRESSHSAAFTAIIPMCLENDWTIFQLWKIYRKMVTFPKKSYNWKLDFFLRNRNSAVPNIYIYYFFFSKTIDNFSWYSYFFHDWKICFKFYRCFGFVGGVDTFIIHICQQYQF